MNNENRVVWIADPRKRRAFAHASVDQARRNPTDAHLAQQALDAVENAGTSRKSLQSGFQKAIARLNLFKNTDGRLIENVIVLDKKDSDHDYCEWVDQGQPVDSFTNSDRRAITLIRCMALAGVKAIDVTVVNTNQVVPANCYRQAELNRSPDLNVRIVVDPHNRIPAGGLRGRNRVIQYHFD